MSKRKEYNMSSPKRVVNQYLKTSGFYEEDEKPRSRVREDKGRLNGLIMTSDTVFNGKLKQLLESDPQFLKQLLQPLCDRAEKEIKKELSTDTKDPRDFIQ